MILETETHSPTETESLAADFANQFLRPGDCLALDGDLGAGKTQFVRGLVTGLGGIPRAVSSPTFVLLNVYPTPKFTVYHLDAYRVTSSQDFESIGFPELLQQNQIVVVEWASRIARLLPTRYFAVEFQVLSETDRRITIERIGPE